MNVRNLIIILTMNASMMFAQADSVAKKSAVKADSVAKKTSVKEQAPENQFTGIAVSPASFHLNLKPGSTQVKELTISNDTKVMHKFQLSLSDFRMGRTGKPEVIKAEDSKYALSKWISLSPTYVELKPGESKKIGITIRIPGDESGNIAAWTLINVDNLKDKAPLSKDKVNEKALNIGVSTNFGFGVYVYQNPPNVAVNNVAIQKIIYKDTAGVKNVSMTVKNIGDGIGFCTSYLELTSLATGKKVKLGTKQFTILPQFYRDFTYALPANLAKGKYSALGVIDYGNDEDIKVAELEINIE